MQLSDPSAFDAALEQCATFALLAPLAGTPPSALAESMTQTGIALLVRDRGAADAAKYIMVLLHAALRDEAAHGH